MFIIVKDNFIEYGPKEWNKSSFEYMIYHLTLKKIKLPNENTDAIVIDEDCKIYPIIKNIRGAFNDSFSQKLIGPFWEFTDTHAIASYDVDLMPLNKIKNEIKEKIKKIKNRKINGFNVTININNNDISFFIDENEKRNIFQKYSILNEESIVQWKHSNGWTELSKINFKQLVDAVNNYIEEQFVWEKTKHDEIDACQSIDELKAFIQNEHI